MEALDLLTHPGHLARRLQQVAFLMWTTMVSEEITPPQFAVLNGIVREPGIDQKRLGEQVSLDRSTVADVVARLTRRGMIERVRDPKDGRRNVLKLTAEGEAVFGELASRSEEMNTLLFAPLDDQERDTLMALMTRLVRSGERLKNSERISA